MEWFIEICEHLKRRFVPIHYDATFHSAEQYYTSVYMDYIQPFLAQMEDRFPLNFLDAGCGTGRFLVPFANKGHRMTAIDFHKDSLRIAIKNAREANAEIEAHDGNFEVVLNRFDDNSFDAVMAIESLHTSKNRTAVMRELSRVLRPGGFLFATHRPRFYFLARALAKGALDDALLIAQQTQGRLRKKVHRIHYNWQSKADIEELYPKLGLLIRDMYSIGPYSGCESDPKASICDPQQLSQTQREKLKQVECNADAEAMMASRYVLVIARKEGHPKEEGHPSSRRIARSESHAI